VGRLLGPSCRNLVDDCLIATEAQITQDNARTLRCVSPGELAADAAGTGHEDGFRFETTHVLVLSANVQ
jgi:hypothetical protein